MARRRAEYVPQFESYDYATGDGLPDLAFGYISVYYSLNVGSASEPVFENVTAVADDFTHASPIFVDLNGSARRGI